MILNKLYRKKVIAIITDGKGNFLIDQLTTYGKNHWNFPGGGIEKCETEENALIRELKEELGTNKFKIIKKSKITTSYNWPLKVIIRRLIKNKGYWIGQTQRHFLVKFEGNMEDIIPDPIEIRKIKWVKEGEFKHYLNFKKQLIETNNILSEFKITKNIY